MCVCVGTVRLYLFWAVLLRRSVTVPGPLLPPFSAVRREIFPFLSPHSDNVYIVPIVMLTPGVGGGVGGGAPSSHRPAARLSLLFPSQIMLLCCTPIFSPRQRVRQPLIHNTLQAIVLPLSCFSLSPFCY